MSCLKEVGRLTGPILTYLRVTTGLQYTQSDVLVSKSQPRDIGDVIEHFKAKDRQLDKLIDEGIQNMDGDYEKNPFYYLGFAQVLERKINEEGVKFHSSANAKQICAIKVNKMVREYLQKWDNSFSGKTGPDNRYGHWKFLPRLHFIHGQDLYKLNLQDLQLEGVSIANQIGAIYEEEVGKFINAVCGTCWGPFKFGRPECPICSRARNNVDSVKKTMKELRAQILKPRPMPYDVEICELLQKIQIIDELMLAGVAPILMKTLPEFIEEMTNFCKKWPKICCKKGLKEYCDKSGGNSGSSFLQNLLIGMVIFIIFVVMVLPRLRKMGQKQVESYVSNPVGLLRSLDDSDAIDLGNKLNEMGI